MSSCKSVYMLGSGMVTPVGGDTAMTAAAVRAGINSYSESAHQNKYKQPIKMALVPDEVLPPLDGDLHKRVLQSRQRRLLQLASVALNELVQSLQIVKPLPLFLAGPETLPGCPAGLRSDFLNLLQAQTGVQIEHQSSRIFAQGKASGIQAIDMAFRLFSSGRHDYAIVGGVDSFLDPLLLGVLDDQDRLLASSVPDGFVPGEAAGFLLLASERAAQKVAKKALLKLAPPGLGQEDGHRYNPKVPYCGEGLSAAFSQGLTHVGKGKIRTIYSSLNGESFGAKEYGVSMVRHKQYFDENVLHEHPADCFGDIGAAFTPVIIGINAIFMQQKTATGPAFAYCSSDKALRGAICMNRV